MVKTPEEARGVPLISQNEPIWVRIGDDRFQLDLAGRVAIQKMEFAELIRDYKRLKELEKELKKEKDR